MWTMDCGHEDEGIFFSFMVDLWCQWLGLIPGVFTYYSYWLVQEITFKLQLECLLYTRSRFYWL